MTSRKIKERTEAKAAQANVIAAIKKAPIPLQREGFGRIWHDAITMMLKSQKLLKKEIKTCEAKRREGYEAELRHLESIRRRFRYLGLPITEKEYQIWNIGEALVESLKRDLKLDHQRKFVVSEYDARAIVCALVVILQKELGKEVTELHRMEDQGQLQHRMRQLICYLDSKSYYFPNDDENEIKDRNQKLDVAECEQIIEWLVNTGEEPDEDDVNDGLDEEDTHDDPQPHAHD